MDDEQDAEQPAVIEQVALTTPDRPVPARVYTPKVSYPVPAKKSHKDCEEMKCKKMLEELNVKFSLMDAIQMIPVGVKNGYDEVNVQIPEEEKRRKLLRQILF